MTRSLSIAVVTLFLLSLRVVAFPQSGLAVTGTIRDQNGAVIVKADVEMVHIAGGRRLTTQTDLSGNYEFADLPLGAYQLSVKADGFATAIRSITVPRNGSYDEDFVLLPGQIESDIIVTLGKGGVRIAAETPQVVTMIEASQIEQRRPWSTLQALEKTPNLTPVIANRAPERPRLRGLASNRLLLVLASVSGSLLPALLYVLTGATVANLQRTTVIFALVLLVAALFLIAARVFEPFAKKSELIRRGP